MMPYQAFLAHGKRKNIATTTLQEAELPDTALYVFSCKAEVNVGFIKID